MAKRYNKKWASAHLHRGKDSMLIKITTGPNWRGGDEIRGQVRKVLFEDDKYWADDGGFYCMGDGSWILVEDK